jgi:hypothetical protein
MTYAIWFLLGFLLAFALIAILGRQKGLRDMREAEAWRKGVDREMLAYWAIANDTAVECNEVLMEIRDRLPQLKVVGEEVE